ncbi:MAG TPA: hypothetical protein VL027_00925 [Spongiibacteraceae bacterium]|nr:hypothetical protein [Spongiibacteraceae bacterium]HUH36486.1 hypothetical protein [Spongiibacteraceae bacterium]
MNKPTNEFTGEDDSVLETDWWVVDIPPEWIVEQEDDSVLIGDADGVGVIEISTLLAESADTGGPDTEALFSQLSPVPGRATQLAGLPGLYATFEDDDQHVRQWCVGNSKLVLVVSYCCDPDDAGMDDSAVDAILDTLSIATALLD